MPRVGDEHSPRSECDWPNSIMTQLGQYDSVRTELARSGEVTVREVTAQGGHGPRGSRPREVTVPGVAPDQETLKASLAAEGWLPPTVNPPPGT